MPWCYTASREQSSICRLWTYSTLGGTTYIYGVQLRLAPGTYAFQLSTLNGLAQAEGRLHIGRAIEGSRWNLLYRRHTGPTRGYYWTALSEITSGTPIGAMS